MLAVKYRLKGNSVFRKIEKEGKIIQSDSFGIAFLTREDSNASCFGVVVSKKISNEAVLRNRIKRAVFEAIRQNWIDVKAGFDVVVLAKSASLRKSTDELMKETKETLKKAGIMK